MSEEVIGGILKNEEFGESNANHEELEMFVLLTLHSGILLTASAPDAQKVMGRVTD